jgi:C_GCAxxG_C_C family probable redox protein
MSDAGGQARSGFLDGLNCAQAVLTTFCEPLGLDRATAIRLAESLGGGIGGMGLTCGALSGGSLVLGLKLGRTQPVDPQAKDATRQAVRELFADFARRQGSCVCSEILGIDMTDPEQVARARENGLFRRRCPDAVADAAEIVQQMLAGS